VGAEHGGRNSEVYSATVSRQANDAFGSSARRDIGHILTCGVGRADSTVGLTVAHASKASPNFSLGVQVIIEHEFLEQVAETSEEWSLSRSVEFIGRYKDPWPVLRALHQDKC
jgi:hypothetical protein